MSGKTTLAKKKIKALKESTGRKVIVLDPLNDSGWNADFQTSNPEIFLQTVWNNTNCIVVIDEAGDAVGKYNDVMNSLATKGRHWGHKVFFICQRSKMISTTIRSQCSDIIVFKSSRNDTKDLADEFVEPALLDADKLEMGEFIYCRHGQKTVRGSAFKI